MTFPIARRVVRAALVQTACGYPMPERLTDLPSLAGRLAALRAESLARHVKLLETAARLGARLAAFGELFATPFFPVDADPLWRPLAEEAAEGPTAAAVREAARRFELVLIAPFYEFDRLSGKRFSAALVVDSDGRIAGCARKVHLASGTGPDGLSEAFHYEPSDGRQSPRTGADASNNPYFPVFETAVGRLGVALGVDRRLPGAIESLAREGAEVALALQAASDAESKRLWEAESVVDAARHRLFIGAGNRVGREGPWGREYFGGSAWFGPAGKLPDESPIAELIVSDLDLAALAEQPTGPLRPARDARPETYSPRRRRAPPPPD